MAKQHNNGNPIKKVGNNKFQLINIRTGKVLGHHPSRAAAYKQLQAIEAHKHGDG